MQGIVPTRIFLFISGLIIVPLATIAVILFARGYRPTDTGKLTPTGLLVAKSTPDSAQLIVNGDIKSATNTTLNLSPGSYTIEIKKDGFFPWKKQLAIQAEIVTRATAWLFPSVPSLKAITSSGAFKPSFSPDGTKVAYIVSDNTQSNIYTLDLNESPLGLLNRDPKLISNLNFQISNLLWSPDSREIVAVATAGSQLIDLASSQTRPVSDNLTSLQNTWKQRLKLLQDQQLDTLPDKIEALLATSSANLVLSPKEDKLIYTATASAILPNELIKALPGSSTQPQERSLVPGHVYLYDLEEDRNFRIDSISLPTPTLPQKPLRPTSLALSTDVNGGWRWFPTSNHIYRLEGNRIVIKEYDNQNQTIVYAGPLNDNFVAPYPSGKQILILTNLTPNVTTISNLYAISLK